MDQLCLRRPLKLRAIAIFLLLWSIVAPVNGLYFYLHNTDPKCFFEELPKDTLVVGAYSPGAACSLIYHRTSLFHPILMPLKPS